VEHDARPITVVVADDHELFRRGMQTVLGMEAGFDVLAQAADGEEAVAKVAELAPDVVLMDVRMPGIDGIEAARRIRRSTPSTRVVMLTISDEEDDLYGAVRAGANGYLLKDSSLEDVAEAVRAVARGESLISPSMASKLLAEFTAVTGRAGAPEEEGAPRLSPREIEVLKLVAQGRTNREVAAALHLSENTVKNHVANILDKLHLRSRVEAAMYAVRAKLVELP
jgi:two-component system NarL family response regulator